MVTPKVFGAVAVVIFLAMAMSGCLTSDSDDEVVQPVSCSVGDTWIYQGDDGNTTVEVTEADGEFGGWQVAVLKVTLDSETATPDGTEIFHRDMVADSAWFGLHVHEEIIQSTTFISDFSYYTTTDIITKTTEIDRTFPAEFAVGQTWTIHFQEHFEMKNYLNGDFSNSVERDTEETVRYEVLSQGNVTVPAGTFLCYEIRGVHEQSGLTTLDYFSPEVKSSVKKVKSYNDTVMVSQLVSYDLMAD